MSVTAVLGMSHTVLYDWRLLNVLWLYTVDMICYVPVQKIMHTRKRHQDMFQDLNRKIHSADKDRESPPVDAKAAKRWSVSSTSSDKTNMSVRRFFLCSDSTHLTISHLILFPFFQSLPLSWEHITTLEWCCSFSFEWSLLQDYMFVCVCAGRVSARTT